MPNSQKSTTKHELCAIIIETFILTLQSCHMRVKTSEITNNSIFVQDNNEEIIEVSHNWPFVWGTTCDWWIPDTKGQYYGRRFHVMTSSWMHYASWNVYLEQFVENIIFEWNTYSKLYNNYNSVISIHLLCYRYPGIYVLKDLFAVHNLQFFKM